MTTSTTVNTAEFFPRAGKECDQFETLGLSALARGLVGSEILKISGEIRALAAAGREICNLTVGDFASTEFRIPPDLEAEITKALTEGQTNYPPSDGILELRKEVVRFYESGLGLTYPLESVLIAGGSRPIIYAIYKALVDPGERVLYPIPSWNNNHYCFLTGAEKVELEVGPETNFLPTADLLRDRLSGVRLLCINTPLNPTGTVLEEKEVRAIAQLVVEVNKTRRARGERALYVMWDQVYWMLTFGDARHHTPPELVPESAAWTVFVDGISKAFAATGVRVGWAVGPPYVIARMRDILGHVGAWAPRAEQVATARFLTQEGAISNFHGRMIAGLRERLDLLHETFQQMRRDNLPIDSVPPQGAIYLSTQFQLIGRSFRGKPIRSNEDIRQLLIQEAGFAVVPFQAFGRKIEDGWMRLSVGAVSPAAIAAALPRVRAFLEKCEA
ncbi:MAG TPA: aminotransferase class I/II-fold pyridoxal phosphate-dependent enzyme [Thermoanaerobaculia bacterium]|nr:aminotransferase class I/II-fold pyridoxal phosphate-dependent enzyme [Thermoanaerobaculia bacterium]